MKVLLMSVLLIEVLIMMVLIMKAWVIEVLSLKLGITKRCIVPLVKIYLISGLYYKPIRIVNDDSCIVNELESSLTDYARVIIYNHHMLIVQATCHQGDQFRRCFEAHFDFWNRRSSLKKWRHFGQLLLKNFFF
jgi:hypothetical protein